ncbi:unnamed protein product [Linum tenue]|uniref:Uncharacterized protein n=1 Tax=Linum tenue TaxID=586396 RepID=A0AAV0R621_9ROSI|nr:unnamed protein product [Linum tenue]
MICSSSSSSNGGTEVGISHDHDHELRRGPWTLEEDTLLSHYIARHGEGRWNMLAKCAGLKRTGKSCRLRWLNYLKPDIKRGNLTPKEQLMILELHSKWGNRWSRIAQHLPGRTDNEIKNYWRTRVQRQARQLNIESNSKKFLDAVRCHWMPRLLQKAEQQQITSSSSDGQLPTSSTMPDQTILNHHQAADQELIIANPYYSFPPQEAEAIHFSNMTSLSTGSTTVSYQHQQNPEAGKVVGSEYVGIFSMENCNWNMILGDGNYYEEMVDPLMAAAASGSQSSTADHGLCHVGGDDGNWVGYNYDVADTLWNLDDTWQYGIRGNEHLASLVER